jgi:XTP/dITP diphosphohydrolase
MKAVDLLVASTNLKKLEELRDVLAALPFRLHSLQEFSAIQEVAETGKTFHENATLKALGYARQTRLLTLAEDSGLCCDALEGAPGVYSSRFSGEGGNDLENNRKLLRLMAKLPDNCRQAHFVSCIAVAAPGRSVVDTVEGEVHGYISTEMRGNNGFGYDSVFYYPDFGKTFGEVPPGMKRTVSHRMKALEKVRALLKTYLD